MADVQTTEVLCRPGLNQSNFYWAKAKTATSLPNGDVLICVFPELVGGSWVPVSVSLKLVGSGAEGARTFTSKLITWTFDETTGTLSVTNGSGGAVATSMVDALFVVAGPTPT